MLITWEICLDLLIYDKEAIVHLRQCHVFLISKKIAFLVTGKQSFKTLPTDYSEDSLLGDRKAVMKDVSLWLMKGFHSWRQGCSHVTHFPLFTRRIHLVTGKCHARHFPLINERTPFLTTGMQSYKTFPSVYSEDSFGDRKVVMQDISLWLMRGLPSWRQECSHARHFPLFTRMIHLMTGK